MKKFIIVTGPAGAGNHIFTQVLSSHPQVGGWKELLEGTWIPADQETFADYWINPVNLSAENFDGYHYWVANATYPLYYNGVKQLPKILELAEKAHAMNIDVRIAIVTRDQTIVSSSQERIYNESYINEAKSYYDEIFNSHFPVHFLSLEALYFYQYEYVKWIGRILTIPVDTDNPTLFATLPQDPNEKYISAVAEQSLDPQIQQGLQTFASRNIE